MKKGILIALTLLVAHLGYSQDHELQSFSDIKLAKAYAQEQGLPILMVFAGSDWCRPCIQFKKSILLSESFTAYAEKKLAVVYLDFPLKKANKLSKEQTEHNESLAEKYNPSGVFPEILLIDAEGEILGEIKFKNQSPEVFIASCDALSK